MADIVPADPRDDQGAPLHRRILNDIRAKILSGEWPPGHRIPFEHELTIQYGCSRMTVNKAMSELARTGLIERRRRSGSFVRQPRGEAAILEIHDVRSEVEALGLPYRYELDARTERSATEADAETFSPEPSTMVLELRCRHFAADRPFCTEQRLISLDAVPAALDEGFAVSAPGPWLLDRVPWSAAEHRISAAAADSAMAEALDIEDGAPCLVVERRTWSADRAVTVARFTYPAASHSLVARFSPVARG